MPDSIYKKNNNLPSMARKASRSNNKKDPRIVTGRKSASTPAERPAQRGRTSQSGRKGTSKATNRGLLSATKMPSFPSWSDLSPERKMDIYGVILTLLGVLSLVSFVARQSNEFTAKFLSILFVLTGKGAYLLPLTLIAIGLWLIFRRVERLPAVSGERLVGLLLIYVNILTIFHMISGGGWELAASGGGGGRIGGFFERLLVAGTGTPGALIIITAWGIIGLALVIDIPVQEIFNHLTKTIRNPRKAINNLSEFGQIRRETEQTFDTPGSLPSTFKPLDPFNNFGAKNSFNTGKPDTQTAFQTNSSPEAGKNGSPINLPTAPIIEKWNLPTIEDILDPPTPASIRTSLDQERARTIEETLRSLGAPGRVTEILHGPTVTMFGIEPEFIENRSGKTRVRVGKIAALADDLTLALATPRVRIQAPVPGRDYVGIEVPNTEISRVTLSEVMESDSFKNIRSPLRFALGKNVAGKPVAADLASMPHLLIAGTTGSGKSVCLNSILCSFLINNSPSDLRFILIDPKRVEFNQYNGIPHLLSQVITDPEEVLGALQWMLREMDNRYHKFADAGVRNIQEFNTKFPEDHLQYLVIIVDELADLMMLAPQETEQSVTRLAQLARATGIHLILATQRPSVNVVTGLIKANFPARIAFAVASNVDSRVILDQTGAERLLGRGDLLFQAPDASSPVRLQGVYVSDNEIQRLVDSWRLEAMKQTTLRTSPATDMDVSLPRGVPLKQGPLWEDMKPSDNDPLLDEAIDLVRREGRASITMLQRHMRIGYSRSARLIDAMEEKKIIGPTQAPSQLRDILDYGPTAPPPED